MIDIVKNQKLFFISLIGIVVTSLLLTTTYAYQSLRVNYSDSDPDLTVNAGVLDITFTVSNRINLDNMTLLPNYKTADYVEMTIDNSKSSDDAAYMITLSDLKYDEMFASDLLKYTVVLVNDDGTLTEIKTGSFSSLTGDEFDLELEDRLYKYIDKGVSEKIRLYLWLDENVDVDIDLSSSSNKKFTGVVNISSIFEAEISTSSLYRKIISSAKLALANNDGTRSFYNDTFDLNNITGISGETDKMLAITEDDYGTSYVYRGNVVDNYVMFAGFMWRIVRINGDDSVRLILDGSLDKVYKQNDNGSYNSQVAGNKSIYSTLEKDVYYEQAESQIKKEIDLFYENYIKSYEQYLSDSLFCSEGAYDASAGGDSFPYPALNRLENTIISPTLECDKDNTSSTSRYTSLLDLSDNTIKDVSVNNNLTYPIALISADEVSMAGAYLAIANEHFYLFDAVNDDHSYYSWWTMTPREVLNNDENYTTMVYSYGYGFEKNATTSEIGVRPVINLKSEILVDSGDGTQANPYKVKLVD